MRLDGHAAIVTGGASGLGAATAERLARAGCRVAVLDINQAAAEASAHHIGGIGIACDVADAASAEAAVAKAREAHGPARLLVNCAGVGTAGRIVGRDGPIQVGGVRTRDPHQPDRQLQSAAACGGRHERARSAGGRRTRRHRQHRIDRGLEGQVGQAAYAASKAGVVGMTLPAARELARVGVRVVTIAPGLFHTPMVEGLPHGVADRASAKAFHFRSGLVNRRNLRRWSSTSRPTVSSMARPFGSMGRCACRRDKNVRLTTKAQRHQVTEQNGFHTPWQEALDFISSCLCGLALCLCVFVSLW